MSPARAVSLPVRSSEGATDPHGGVRRFADFRASERASCEVVVVGSGPGGAVVAMELALAGIDVILLEEGPPIGKSDMRLEAGESLQRLVREGGARATRGNAILPTMQAIALGGGSLVNSAICCRAPDWALSKWAEKAGSSALEAGALAPHYERVERFLGVSPTPMEVQGERNLLFKRGCDALGYSSEPIHRNVQNCGGSGECFTGCRNGAKRSTDVSYVPATIAAGGRVWTSVRVTEVRHDGRRAIGVAGQVVEPFTGRVTHSLEVSAKLVVLAAGCMQTPLLLERSGLGGGYVGRELQLHPGLAVMGVFPDLVEPWQGATQGYHSLHFLREGLKLEVLWSPPSVLAARLPGFGHDYQRILLDYRRMAPFDVIVAADHSRGTVRPRAGGLQPDITFHFDQRDFDKIRRGVTILSDICWAAGAESILPGLQGVPDVLHSADEAKVLATAHLEPKDAISAANHAFGTTRISARSSEGVVDDWGQSHRLDGLYLADSGIFPDSPGVNPMLTTMALADRVAQGLIGRLGRSRAELPGPIPKK